VLPQSELVRARVSYRLALKSTERAEAPTLIISDASEARAAAEEKQKEK
jgi:hypothetical protein